MSEIKNREAVKAFKKECRNYFYYLADIREIMRKIQRTRNKMTGVHSVDLQRIRIRRDPKKTYLVKFIEKKTELEKELQKKEEKVMNIINTIDRIELPAYRVIVWMVFVQRRTYTEVAKMYGVSKVYLAEEVNRVLADIVPPLKEGETAGEMVEDPEE
ncbi:MAG: hypothetical protein IKE28_02930 [Solobacterium sp.]|nr:hypothetical protein [Solobacterium sp.]